MTARRLIVNADDLGLTEGVNRAVAEAHAAGVLTSASLMVGEPAAADAAELARSAPRLAVGLHAVAPDGGEPGTGWPDALQEQLARFEELLGRPPTHLDSHHNVHRGPAALPHFMALARELRVPLREYSPARYVSSFYGRWDDESHPEQVSVDGFLALVDAHAGEGWTELACHPAHVDASLHSSYAAERELELRTLLDARLPEALRVRGIELASFADLAGEVAA